MTAPMQISGSSSSSSSAKGGEFMGGTSSFMQGAWNVNTASNGQVGLSTNTVLLIAAGAGVLWFLTRKRKA